MTQAAELLSPQFTWNNQDNIDNFYNNPKVLELALGYAKIGGIDKCCDVDLIYNNIKNSNSILEIGAGYGRVIENLYARGYAGKIHVVEASDFYCQLLKKKFSEKITLHGESILNFTNIKKYDVILSLWCGISDFLPTEQQLYFHKLAELLQDDGVVYLDILGEKLINSTSSNGQNFRIDSNSCMLDGFIPTVENIYCYTEAASLKKVTTIKYLTTTGRTRIMFEIKK